MKISTEEKDYISIMRLNKILGTTGINKSWKLGRLGINFEWRSSKNLWGRFGGGWNWKFGFQAGGSTLIFSLFICTITFKIINRTKPI